MDGSLTITVIILCLYRIISLLVGLSIIYMGYKLFYHGVFDKAGDLEAVWGKHPILLKQAAPGTFFFLFGTIAINFALWKRIDLDISIGNSGETTVSTSDKKTEQKSDNSKKETDTDNAKAGKNESANSNGSGGSVVLQLLLWGTD